MKKDLASSLRLALARGCELECDLQVITSPFTVDGAEVHTDGMVSQKKATTILAEEQRADLAAVLAWQRKNKSLPCGVWKGVLPYSAIKRRGVRDAADWCEARLQEAASHHKTPPSEIGDVPVVTDVLSEDEELPVCHTRVLRDRSCLQFLMLVADLLREKQFPCAIVVLAGKGEQGIVTETYPMTLGHQDNLAEEAERAANELVEMCKTDFIKDNGFSPAIAAGCLVLGNVPVSDVVKRVTAHFDDLYIRIIPRPKNCRIRFSVLAPEECVEQ